MGKKVQERAATEAEGIAKTLSERYNQPFDLNELLVYVDYKKEKEGKKTDNNIVTPPKDPNAGTE
ncbi:MAG: hypothetical protein Q8941_01335 [Bacteroidota bacterium]|nr:hypothetical protein [Bacteroidota bacterium]